MRRPSGYESSRGSTRFDPSVSLVIFESLAHEGVVRLMTDPAGRLQKIAGGKRNSDIASLLFISEEIKRTIKHIMQKLGASDRTGAVAIGIRRGLIHL